MRARITLLLLGLLLFPLRAEALTIVVDFKDFGEPVTPDIIGGEVGFFDIASFGFADTTANRTTLYNSILSELERDYHDIPTVGQNPLSPIPDGHELDIDFVIGDVGTAPSNGDTEFYYMLVGTGVVKPSANTLGQAFQDAVRDSSGNHSIFIPNGIVVGSVFTDSINGLGFLTPPNALTSGNLSFTTHAINGTLAHEIGHTVSLDHLDKALAVTPNGLPPLMATGAIDLPNQDRLFDREFSFSGFDSQDGGAARMYLSQLVDALGTRPVPLTAVPEPSTIVLAAVGFVGLCWLRRRGGR
ncbi:MAG: PEP-CTERM sorting domain-containing protein [Planctomycetota bacterium]|nr:MAG: PEP-CTERM sorting domain-containing protein [Planctomycetota bacterium]REJ96726.1 MAG: PEP-CTERM sorting domain-containing protein [Planctomycetota bacterium]REK22328.1 MAG: PEP-CTERM sorting domain-containing protein [Planctomycetota bacterium]REK41045.1 MAG: PEP-CTERM sorting domain-containing protein [Planctomycetota bacterium]